MRGVRFTGIKKTPRGISERVGVVKHKRQGTETLNGTVHLSKESRTSGHLHLGYPLLVPISLKMMEPTTL